MFEDMLLHSGARFTSSRITATTLMAFALQALLVGILVVVIPLKPQVVPARPPVQTVVLAPPPLLAPPVAAPAPRVREPEVTKPVRTKLPDQVVRTPVKIPEKRQVEKQEAPPLPPPALGVGVLQGAPAGLPGGQLASSAPPVPVAQPHAATPQRVPVSQSIIEALLLHQVTPRYPPSALHAHIHGAVVLDAVISKDGSIGNVRAVQGDPVLISAAMDAVRQWKYKPYYLDGQPIEVETIITVNFNLPHG
jgi:protein TonB